MALDLQMDKVKSVEKEIEEVISHSPVETDPVHSKNTRMWVLKLNPEADEALQIAALAHDIERGLEPDYFVRTKSKFKDYNKHKRIHSEKSARIIEALLIKYGFDEGFIKKVKHLVLNHETGGDKDSNTLRDADSISFFEDNLKLYYHKHTRKFVEFKIKYMFNRMSKRSKNIVKKFDFRPQELKTIFNKAIS